MLKKITLNYPNLFQSDLDITVEMLSEIPSIQEKTAKKIIENLAEIRQFITEHPEFKFKDNKINLQESNGEKN